MKRSGILIESSRLWKSLESYKRIQGLEKVWNLNESSKCGRVLEFQIEDQEMVWHFKWEIKLLKRFWILNENSRLGKGLEIKLRLQSAEKVWFEWEFEVGKGHEF